MNKIISLIKTDLNITFGLSSIIDSFKSKKNRWQIILFSVAMLSLIPTYFLLIKGLIGLYDGFRQMGQQSYFLMMGFLAAQGMVLFFGIMYVMSKYYFSNDLNHLVPLPIKPSYILSSKFATLMVSEYITSLPIFLPFVFIYGIKGKLGFLYWVYTFFITLTLPILPLALASILVMIFMKYTNIKGKKDLFRVIMAVIFMILVVYLQMIIQRVTQSALSQGEDFFFNLARDSNLLVKKLGLVFPPSMWGALALVNFPKFNGLLNLLYFVISGIIGFIMMLLLSEKLFFEGLIGNIEASVSKGRGKKRELSKTSNVTKPYIALAKKEIIMLAKTPVYLLNSIGGVIIVPIVLLFSIKAGDKSIEPLLDILYANSDIVTLALIGFIAFYGIVNNVGTTTFSREGKNFWIQRTLPIKVEDQINGRILSSLIIQLLGALILILAVSLIIRLNIVNVLWIILLGLAASIPMTQIGMIIDILRPMLTWTNPQQAMKQNLNVLIGMGVAVIYGGSIGFLIFKLIGKINTNIIYLVIATIVTISAVIFNNVLKKLVTKQFRELE